MTAATVEGDFFSLFEIPQYHPEEEDLESLPYGMSLQVDQYHFQEQVARVASQVDREQVLDANRRFLEGWDKLQTCVTCGRQYQPKVNFLRRECYVHTCPFPVQDNETKAFIHSCCGALAGTTGCVSSCHFTDYYKRNTVIMRFLDEQNMLKIPCIVIDQNIIPHDKSLIYGRSTIEDTGEPAYLICCLAVRHPFFLI
jgi:hypothetical protein